MKIGVVQCNSIDDEAANLAKLESLIRSATAGGVGKCDLVVLPEVAYYRGKSQDADADVLPGRTTAFISRLAAEEQCWIHGGTFAESVKGNEKRFNTSFLMSPEGKCAAVYRKIHLFDVDLPGLRLVESETFDRGREIVVTELGEFTAGMLVCYDLRFPGVWSACRARGANLFFLPANFTEATGAAHWEALLRARAIETQSYIAASAQWGPHPHRGFSAYGRSMIVDPWGTILAEAPREGDCVITADCDIERVKDIRLRMPVHSHCVPEIYSQ